VEVHCGSVAVSIDWQLAGRLAVAAGEPVGEINQPTTTSLRHLQNLDFHPPSTLFRQLLPNSRAFLSRSLEKCPSLPSSAALQEKIQTRVTGSANRVDSMPSLGLLAGDHWSCSMPIDSSRRYHSEEAYTRFTYIMQPAVLDKSLR
jgi:hypothetical protein